MATMQQFSSMLMVSTCRNISARWLMPCRSRMRISSSLPAIRLVAELSVLEALAPSSLQPLIKRATKQTITDPTSGMRMYNRKMIEVFAREFDISPEPDTISLLIRKGAKVIEIPAEMRERQGGTSYLRHFSAVSYMARTCLSLLLFQWFR